MCDWTLTDWHNLVRMISYFVGTILAVLTFWKAKNGLLNTVNTEYQKRVMDRLKEIADKLYAEFDPDSPEYWARDRAVHDEIEQINKIFARDKAEILAFRLLAVWNPRNQVHNPTPKNSWPARI
jgi:hypothetical protein